MKTLDLRDYSLGAGREQFDVRGSLVAVLFNEPNLDPREVIRRDELARKIERTTGDSILLEDAEWSKIRSGLKSTDLKPLGRDVAEFCRRVMDAPAVHVAAVEGSQHVIVESNDND